MPDENLYGAFPGTSTVLDIAGNALTLHDSMGNLDVRADGNADGLVVSGVDSYSDRVEIVKNIEEGRSWYLYEPYSNGIGSFNFNAHDVLRDGSAIIGVHLTSSVGGFVREYRLLVFSTPLPNVATVTGPTVYSFAHARYLNSFRIAAAPDGSFYYIVAATLGEAIPNISAGATLIKITPAGSIASQITTYDTDYLHIVVSGNGNRLLISRRPSGVPSLAVMDADDLSELFSIPVASYGRGLAASSSGDYFAACIDNAVLLIDVSSGPIEETFTFTGARSAAFSMDGTVLYASSTAGQLLAIDVATRAPIGTYAIGFNTDIAIGSTSVTSGTQFGLLLDRFGGETTAGNVEGGVQIYYTVGTVAQRETRALIAGLKSPTLYAHGGQTALLAQDSDSKAWSLRYSKDWGKTFAEVRDVWDSNYVNAVADSTFLGIEVTAAIEKATKKLVYKYATGNGAWSGVKTIATLEKIVPLEIRARNETRNSGIVIYASPDRKWQSAGVTNEFVVA